METGTEKINVHGGDSRIRGAVNNCRIYQERISDLLLNHGKIKTGLLLLQLLLPVLKLNSFTVKIHFSGIRQTDNSETYALLAENLLLTLNLVYKSAADSAYTHNNEINKLG